MKFEKLNKILKAYSNPTLRSYSENDPYLESLRQMREVNQRKADKFTNRDKKLKRKERLLPPKKV